MAPDLDLRPGEPTRSTMAHWVQTCSGCGATAADLAGLPISLLPILDTELYRSLAGSADGRPFLRWAVLAEALGQRDDAAQAVLQAAWALDDAGDEAGAKAFRRKAAALWGRGSTIQTALQVLDTWRRAGDRDAAQSQSDHIASLPRIEETDAAVLRFQDGLIAAGDTGRHLLSSALRPPARTPHVTHGRPSASAPARAAPGLWQRLFGR